MAYAKQNFENGQVLTAEHLNHMEQGIVDAVSVTPQTLTDGQKAQARENIGAVTKSGISLGIHSDGLIYVFVDGSPVGDGIELATAGDVIGYVDENNNVILTGALADGTYNIKYEMEDGSTVDIGDLVLDTNVYYSVTNALTNCVSNNSATEVIEGESYSATITANEGYELSSVVVTMGGTDISSTAVSGGTISIANVTGNIVITAVAEEIKASYTNLATKFQSGKRYNSSGAIVDQADACAVEDYIPFTVGTVVRIKGFGAMDKYTCPLYLSNKTTVNTVGKVNALSSHMDYSYDSTSKVVTITAKNANNAWIRIAGVLTGTTADVIITVNEEIV